jgi:hypothetical protein
MSKEYADCEILEFVSGGPKQYQLTLKNKSDGKIWHKQKIRGFTLDRNNEFDAEEFKEMILNYRPDKRKEFDYPDKFGPTSDAKVLTRHVKKFYKPVNHKGLIDDELNVLPYGYIPG